MPWRYDWNRKNKSASGEVTVVDKKKKKAAKTELKLPGYSINDIASMTVEAAKNFFADLELAGEGAIISEPIVREIGSRLGFMFDVGLGYLALSRKTGTLSGGEAQRIRLATQVGSKTRWRLLRARRADDRPAPAG